MFSVEKRTHSDFAVFLNDITYLQTHKLPNRLGDFVGSPHRKDEWFISYDEQLLFQAISNSTYVQYSHDSTLRSTRFSLTFVNPTYMTGQCPRTTRASVQSSDDDSVIRVHSTAATFSPAPQRRSFLERIRAQPNQTLWRTFVTDGEDGTWIYESLLANTLVMMSDGAYEPLLADDVCSCAAAVMCLQTRNRASVTWVEQSDQLSANNYRAEILGGIALQLLVRVACKDKYTSPYMSSSFGCDNKGVHGALSQPNEAKPQDVSCSWSSGPLLDTC